ncbi:unnamed protein product [Didymodactylos carnosus]|uniref:Uncharacterized protein n=1 Tax=Didymodactylos carnosus TaxID=1234261 RepID=A0A815CFV7_9BILA|nr:unnamed protein product [Didymodactylos carnosus]CAF4081289.1 unnamed protein product [Didymodactylos carnosus]
MVKRLLLFILLSLITAIKSSHFNGGTITWKPVNNTDLTTPIQVSITQNYVWVLTGSSGIPCPGVGSLVVLGTRTGCCNATLDCISNCGTTSAGYVAPLIVPYCTSVSTTLSLTYSQRTDIVNLNSNDHFTAAFVANSGSYRALYGSGTRLWAVATDIDLRPRTDNGLINTPPISLVFIPTSIPLGKTTKIQVPYVDPDGDYVACRWSTGTECKDVCYPTNIPANTTVSNTDGCFITITPLSVSDWYCAPLQVEDFYTSTSSSSLSSVPVQFLINVYTMPTYTVPVMNSTDSACIGVQVGVQWSTTLDVYQAGGTLTSRSISTIDVQQTFTPGVTEGSIIQATTDHSLYTESLSWTPQQADVGPQIVCAVARDSSNIPSNTYCLSFVVASDSVGSCPGQPTTVTTTTTTSTTTTTTATTTT